MSASVLLLFVAGLMALAMIRRVGWRTCHVKPATRSDEGSLDSADEHDLMRMDSDKG